MTHCPTCGAPRRVTASRGPLTVRSQPYEAFWHGRKIAMAPMRVRLLFPLVQFGEVASSALDMLLSEGASVKALHVHMSWLRKAFQREHIPATITNIPGWGYRLDVKTEQRA